jgi:hypothetical protein
MPVPFAPKHIFFFLPLNPGLFIVSWGAKSDRLFPEKNFCYNSYLVVQRTPVIHHGTNYEEEEG